MSAARPVAAHARPIPLRRHVLAATLAAVAGYTNAVALIFCGVTVSHVSGNATHLGESLFLAGQAPWLWLGLIATFWAGSFVSALLTGDAHHTRRTLRRAAPRHGRSRFLRPLVIETFLLAMFAVGVTRTADLSAATHLKLAFLAALAMGMQNATVTRVSGAVVRTTHMTGVVTDLAIAVADAFLWWSGHLTRATRGRRSKGVRQVRVWQITRRQPAVRRAVLFVSILASFVAGAGLGTLALRVSPPWSMVPPVIALAGVIVAFTISSAGRRRVVT